MNSPLVSVLIPCYNVGKYVEEAIRSIMNQTYSNLEIICINDGSSDDTKEILLSLAKEDNRIKYIENEQNIKLIATLNKGLGLCNGKYIARMDADDISSPKRIEKQVKFLENNPDHGALGCYIRKFGASNIIWRMEVEDKRIKGYLFYSSPMPHAPIMIRKSVIVENDLSYKEGYLHVEDYKLWSDMSKYTKMANLPEILYEYRIYDYQVSTKYSKEQIENTKKLRKELISDFLGKYGIEVSFERSKYIDYIKQLDSIYNKKNKYQVNYIKIVFYLSLREYNFSTLIRFIFFEGFF